MGLETERKFLVADDGWRSHAIEQTEIRQGYIAVTSTVEVRVRLIEGVGMLTLKSREAGLTRRELDATLPVDVAREAFESFATNALTKIRHVLNIGPDAWTVDVYQGDLEGLILLEIEGALWV